MSRFDKRLNSGVRSGGRVRAVLSVGAVLGLGAVGTLASWSDSAVANTGSFSTAAGSLIEMQLNGKVAAAQFTSFDVSGLMPGEGKAAILAVHNSGDGAFNYTGNVETTGEAILANKLTLRIVRGGTVSGSTCTGGDELKTFTLTPGTPQDTTGAATKLDVDATDNLCVQVTLANPVTKAASNMYVSTKFNFTAVGE